MKIEFKGHVFEIEATVELREAPDNSVVEIHSIYWFGMGVEDLILDFLTSNEVQELDDLIVKTYRDENDL